MKRRAKYLIAKILGWQVKRLVRKNQPKVIAVTGSIGKTSTKLAVAHILSQKYKTVYQKGNYNDIVSVPLIFFERSIPSLFNPLAWAIVLIKNEFTLAKKYPYEMVVVELGTDAPGQIIEFKGYLSADLGVLTSVTAEHMANFADLGAVAAEELAITQFCEELLVNTDLVAEEYQKTITIPLQTYGVKKTADYKMSDVIFEGESASFQVSKGQELVVKSAHNQITEPQLYSVTAAVAVANRLGMEAELIDKGIQSLPTVNGRMQQLKGINNSTIIDDTYNASPEAVKAALDTLYRLQAPQKIAVLGNMNELGKYSEPEHIMVGDYCDPAQLDIVLTIGPDANKFLAPTAEARGCKVKSFDDPYSAGEFLKTVIKDNALILVKGSQNKVFAEETTKLILDNPADAAKLVRQSPQWLKIKRKNFART